MKPSTKIILVIVIIALLPAIISLQSKIDPMRKQFQPGVSIISANKSGTTASPLMVDVDNTPIALPSQFLAGALIGFREVVAGLLWVRCDDFFDNGNYDAIIPLVRIITWLDPHQIDVYRTGAWHLAYIFTDTQERADARYFFPAVALLKEGIANNPGVSDIEMDLGFVMYQQKARDYDTAAYWLEKASKEPDANYIPQRMVAHAYTKGGRLREAEKQWGKCIARGAADLKAKPDNYEAISHIGVSRMNLEGLLIRKAMRADLNKHPVDVGFKAEFKRLGPKTFEISGHANVPDMTRIEVLLHDADYKATELKNFNWKVDPDTTIMTEVGIHGIPVQNGKFSRKYDLTKDPKQYPFVKDNYTLTVMINPRNNPASTQDQLGWNGEGMTDKKYLDTSTSGLRMIKQVIQLKKSEI